MHDFFAVMVLLIERQYDRVRQNVIYEVHAHARGIAEIADLDRRGTVRQDCGARLLGMALEVYGDVDIKIKQNLSYFLVTAQHHVVEMVECFDQTCTDVAAIVATVGDAQYFEVRPIMAFKQVRDLPACRMPIEGRREI